jgi:hypothetical protein
VAHRAHVPLPDHDDGVTAPTAHSPCWTSRDPVRDVAVDPTDDLHAPDSEAARFVEIWVRTFGFVTAGTNQPVERTPQFTQATIGRFAEHDDARLLECRFELRIVEQHLVGLADRDLRLGIVQLGPPEVREHPLPDALLSCAPRLTIAIELRLQAARGQVV